jgi:DNA-binding winged helix-turn-helix (wHTH) protein
LQQYHAPPTPKSTPVLASLPFSQTVLRAVRSLRGVDRSQCLNFLQNTLTGCRNTWNFPLEPQLDQALNALRQDELISEEQGRFYTTSLGDLVYKSGLSLHSARQLNQYVQQHLHPNLHLLDLLLYLNFLDEMQEIYIFVPRSQIQEHVWSRAILHRIEELHATVSAWTDELLASPVLMRREHHRAFKRTLLLLDWSLGTDVRVLEERYGVYSGAIHRLRDELAWLLGCLIDAASAHALEPEHLRQLKGCQTQVLYGLPLELLAWVPGLQKKKLSRRDVLTLGREGFSSPLEIHDGDRRYLQHFLTDACVESLFAFLATLSDRPSPPDDSSPTAPFSVVFTNRPDRVEINGKAISLTPQQFGLLKCLADSCGTCVSYETLLREVWTDTYGDKKLLNRQKQAILKKVERSLGVHPLPLIDVVEGQGLILHGRVIQS